MKTIFVLNGPSLNLLGERDPEVYGSSTLADVESLCRETAAGQQLETVFRQTDEEGELIGWLNEAGIKADGVVINPAAFTHYSVAVRDAIAALECPVIEVHLSNIYAREEFRAHSVVSGVVKGVIAGLGITGYALAIEALAEVIGRDT
ncbi:MAG TPA: type II 3-dehydroquinate dehydratase [Actinomycetota bacterium]|nr:type II 3-dehydroquinate dehydratase [Actinomycetota bacterium]